MVTRPTQDGEPGNLSKIVERTLDFIELFAAQRKPLALSEISRLLRVPLSSCHDVLQALQARGYVTEIAPRAGYYPTMRLYALAGEIARHDPLAQRAERILSALRDQVDETVSLGKVTGPVSGLHLMVFESTHRLRFYNTPGEAVRSLNATAAGKIILGEMSPDAFEAWLAKTKLESMTANTIVSKPELRKSIQAGRARGWYRNDEESVLGVSVIGASFEWLRVRYFVTVAGPTQRMATHLETTAQALLQACQRLTNGEFD